MRIALPLVLLALGVVLVAILMTPHHWEERTYANWKADHDKIEQAKQKWFDKNPEMKTEESDLTSKDEQAAEAFRNKGNDKYKVHAALLNHDLKVRDELVKSDPTLETVYDRLAFDKKVPPFGEGDQELFVEYGEAPYWSGELFVTNFFYVFPALTLGLGIFLLIRPPSWAGAHLLLISLVLPLVIFGPIMLRFATGVYLMQFDEFGERPTPYMFQEAHRVLVRDYLSYVPSLLLYVVLLIRIHFREKKANRI